MKGECRRCPVMAHRLRKKARNRLAQKYPIRAEYAQKTDYLSNSGQVSLQGFNIPLGNNPSSGNLIYSFEDWADNIASRLGGVASGTQQLAEGVEVHKVDISFVFDEEHFYAGQPLCLPLLPEVHIVLVGGDFISGVTFATPYQRWSDPGNEDLETALLNEVPAHYVDVLKTLGPKPTYRSQGNNPVSPYNMYTMLQYAGKCSLTIDPKWFKEGFRSSLGSDPTDNRKTTNTLWAVYRWPDYIGSETCITRFASRINIFGKFIPEGSRMNLYLE